MLYMMLMAAAQASTYYYLDCYDANGYLEGQYHRYCDNYVYTWGRTSGDECYVEADTCESWPPCEWQACPWPEYWSFEECACVGGW
jgi:hypothetical protein